MKLGYKASRSYLTDEQKKETIEWLYSPEKGNIYELERYLMETYDVVFKSRESYYQIWRSANLTWQKGNKENPRKNPEKIETRNQEIAEMLASRREDIEAERLVVYASDECHLQGDEICSYVWGDKKEREIVKVDNDRDRQTSEWCIEHFD